MALERSPPPGGRPMFLAGQGSTVRGSLSLLGYIATSVPFAPRPFGGDGLRDQACGTSGSRGCFDGSYLVDSASSHMLVSKIKPCMSKYKQSYCETANGSLNQLSFI